MKVLGSGSEEAKKNRMEIRTSAYLAIGLLAMVEAKLPDAIEYRKLAAIELDYTRKSLMDSPTSPHDEVHRDGDTEKCCDD
jgi:hypothetical protein